MARWELSRRVLGRLRWLVGLSLLAGFVYFLPSLVFTLPSVQKRVAGWLSLELTDALGAPVSLSRVSMNGWSVLELDGVQVVDSLMRPALYLRSVRADFSWSELLTHQRLRINALRLFAPQISLHQDSVTGRLNIAHILERLKAKDDQGQGSALTFSLHSVLMREGSMAYHRAGERLLLMDSVTLRLSRLEIQEGYMGGMINELSLRYNEELQLSDLATQIELKEGNLLSIHNLVGAVDALPFSLPQIRLDLSSSALGLIQQVQIASLDLPVDKLARLAGMPTQLSKQTHMHLELDVRREADTLHLEHLGLSVGDSILHLESGATLAIDSAGLPTSGQMDVKSLRSFTPHLLSALGASNPSLPAGLSRNIKQLGLVHYDGLLQLSPERELTLNGQLRSALTTLHLDFSALVDSLYLPKRLSGYMAMEGLTLRELLPNGVPLSLSALKVELEAEREQGWLAWLGKARVLVPSLSAGAHRWSQIGLELNGTGGGRYRAKLSNAEGQNHLNASVDGTLTERGVQNISASVQTYALDLRPFLGQSIGEQSTLTLHASTAFSKLDWQTNLAELYLSHLRLDRGADQEEVVLNDVSLHLSGQGRQRSLLLSAPWLAMSMKGEYQLDELPADLLHSLYRRLPVLHALGQPKRGGSHRNDVALSLHIDSIPRGLKALLPFDIDLRQALDLRAQYRDGDDLLDASMDVPELYLGERWFKNLRLELSGNQLSVRADAQPLSGLVCLGAHVDLGVQGDSLLLDLNLGRDSVGSANGEVHLRTHLRRNSPQVRSLKDLAATIELLPSKLYLNKDEWALSHATIDVGADRLSISGLGLSAKERHLWVNGALGMGYADQLDVELKNIHLRYILEVVGVDFDLLDTPLTGRVYAKYNSDKVLRAFASVHSPSFLIDGYDACALQEVGLDWNSQDMVINLHGRVSQPHGGGSSVSGGIKLADGSGIDLRFEAERLDLSFLQVFLGDLFDHTSGYGTGQMRLFGVFADGVTIQGDAQVSEGEIGIRALGTRYFFSDRVQCTPTSIQLGPVRLRDIDGRTATAVGQLEHDYFDHWRINLDIQDIDCMLLLDKPHKTNLPIYGTAYGSGEVGLRTESGRTKIKANLRSEQGTSVKLDFAPSVLDRDHSLMRFTNLRHTSAHSDSLAQQATAPQDASPLDMEFDIDINPLAQIGLILGADATDEIKGRGEGQLKIALPAQGSSTVQGVVRVHEGEYKLRAMQLTNKVFKVREGGTVNFQGDPTAAQMDLEAMYTVSANIADLDETLSSEIRRTNLPVNCILNLRGGIVKPELQYAIEMPSADAEVERRVRSLLNTPEEVAQQVLYLIALGKFNPLNAQNSATNSNLTALASTLVSEQLSSLLGGLSNQFSLSTQIKMNPSLESETEVDLLFNGHFFSDRLLLRGNLGYHDNAYLSNQYIGEFNLEYKLSRSGDLRLKGYRKHNAMYQYMQRSPFTQGVGLSYRTRFQSLTDLMDKLLPWRRRRLGRRSSAVEQMPKPTSQPLQTDTIVRPNTLR